MNILITRHGQTEWNLLKKIQGKSDIELNKTGKKQAEEIANMLKSESIDLIICSPLKRARQTADIINQKNLPIIFDDRISERDFGVLEGKISTGFNFDDLWSYKQNKEYDKVESIKNLFDRVYEFLDDIKEKYKGKNVLIVSHLGVSIPVKCYFNGIPDINSLLTICLDNCEIARYKFKDDNKHTF